MNKICDFVLALMYYVNVCTEIILLVYTSKGRTPIQVFPVHHVYTRSYCASSCIYVKATDSSRKTSFESVMGSGVRMLDRKYLY